MHSIRLGFLIFFSIISSILIVFPELDIMFSKLFYNSDTKFTYSDMPVVMMIFISIPLITKIWGCICATIIFWKILSYKDLSAAKKTPASFLLFAALLGPGLIVNYCFKEQIGRARPRDIIEFGGAQHFTSPIQISAACKTNCSFSSGHAAMGFYFTALAWISALQYQNIVFLLTFSFGSLVGFGRILQGGHFLSDVVFSLIVVLLINEISFRLWTYLNNNTKSDEINVIK